MSAEEEESLQRCGKAVETALATYALISRQSVALNSKSGASHLEDLDGALRLFKRLTERILITIDSMALFRASRFLAVPWCGVKYFVITSVSGAKLHNPTSSEAKSSRR